MFVKMVNVSNQSIVAMVYHNVVIVPMNSIVIILVRVQNFNVIINIVYRNLGYVMVLLIVQVMVKIVQTNVIVM
jgi:hypothetical protein